MMRPSLCVISSEYPNVLLELSGLRAPVSVQSQPRNTALTPEDLEEFRRRGAEELARRGVIIEANIEHDTAPRV